METYKCRCHCGKIRATFRREKNAPLTLWDCNCSDCSMRRNVHFMIPSSDFCLGCSGKFEDETILYQWGPMTAVRRFCRTCGILPFYIPRSNPDGYGITFACIDWGTDGPLKTKIRYYDGVNWEKSHAATGIAKETAQN
ncbi:hypothetical protein ACHAW6_002397 [Cyclotella cf. meneghiniana]